MPGRGDPRRLLVVGLGVMALAAGASAGVAQASDVVLSRELAPLADDGHGTLYGIDPSAGTVVRFTTGGTVLNTVGTSGTGAGALSSPSGVAVAPNGDVLVSDSDTANFPAQEFTPAGAFVRSFGTPGPKAGLAVTAFSGGVAVASADQVATYAADGTPTGTFAISLPAPGHPCIAADPVQDNLLISDRSSTQLRRYSNTGTLLNTMDGSCPFTLDAQGGIYWSDLAGIHQMDPYGEQHGFFPQRATDALAMDGDNLYSTVNGRVLHLVVGKPDATISITPTSPSTSQSVTVSVNASVPFGSVTKIEYDFDGDGTYDTSSQAPTVQTQAAHRYARAGTYDVTVRLTSDDGKQTVVDQPLTVASTSGLTYLDGPDAVLAGSPVTFDTSRSAIDGSQIDDVSWDLDGDGTYETDTGTATSVSRAFTTVGTVDVGVRVLRSGGVADTAHRVVSVRPVPPSGAVGISIDDGDRYTNDPDVLLHVVWPALSATATLANDGGFANAVTRPLAEDIPWRLDDRGADGPRTVYLRFDNSAQTFQDDIVLDRSRPTISSATVSRVTATASRAARAARAARRTYRVRLRARDGRSGVGRVQIAVRSRRHPAKAVRYRSSLLVRAAQRPRYVRVEDRAGNWSRWRALKSRR